MTGPTPSGFVEALLAAERPVIMEVKRKDAHGHDLLGDRTVASVVAGYEAAGAPCLSVVTGRWFGGTDDTLREVAELTDLPLLQKDFLTRQSQLVKARDLGASAVLLTAALLPASALAKLVDQGLGLGLVPFVEVTTEAEVAAVPHAEDCVVAVNNKDIKVQERDAGDIDRSLAMLAPVRRSGTRCPVSASGITDPAVAGRLLDAGFAGLLVGTALLRSGHAGEWMAALPARRRQLPGLGGLGDPAQQVVAAGPAEPTG
jgi:indole-3-glycerol phosphate synthase